jgi:hypothetical protein
MSFSIGLELNKDTNVLFFSVSPALGTECVGVKWAAEEVTRFRLRLGVKGKVVGFRWGTAMSSDVDWD